MGQARYALENFRIVEREVKMCPDDFVSNDKIRDEVRQILWRSLMNSNHDNEELIKQSRIAVKCIHDLKIEDWETDTSEMLLGWISDYLGCLGVPVSMHNDTMKRELKQFAEQELENIREEKKSVMKAKTSLLDADNHKPDSGSGDGSDATNNDASSSDSENAQDATVVESKPDSKVEPVQPKQQRSDVAETAAKDPEAVQAKPVPSKKTQVKPPSKSAEKQTDALRAGKQSKKSVEVNSNSSPGESSKTHSSDSLRNILSIILLFIGGAAYKWYIMRQARIAAENSRYCFFGLS